MPLRRDYDADKTSWCVAGVLITGLTISLSIMMFAMYQQIAVSYHSRDLMKKNIIRLDQDLNLLNENITQQLQSLMKTIVSHNKTSVNLEESFEDLHNNLEKIQKSFKNNLELLNEKLVSNNETDYALNEEWEMHFDEIKEVFAKNLDNLTELLVYNNKTADNLQREMGEMNNNLNNWKIDLNEINETFANKLNLMNAKLVVNNKTVDELKGIIVRLKERMDGFSDKVDAMKQVLTGLGTDVDVLKNIHKKKKFYVDTSEKLSWYTAVDRCKARNMRLAAIESQQEQDEVVSMLRATGKKGGFLTSGHWSYSLNLFEWKSNRQPLSYTNWYKGEPNRFVTNNGHEECVCLEHGFNYQWNDVSCDHLRYFICEY